MNTTIRPKTVKIIDRLIKPCVEEGVISTEEKKEIISQLKNIAEKGEELPDVTPRLIDQSEAASMVGVALSNWKKLEREGKLHIPRKYVGSSVRYRNTDVIRYILSEDE